MANTSIRAAFGQTIYKLAKTNKNLYVVSMDLKSSLHLDPFAKTFKSRFIECGVAENNAAAVAAGLAKSGKTVFLTSFSCFSPAINWAVIKQSICYNHANVKIVGSHSGLLSAELGATHQMLEDIALMRSLPNMEVFAPLDALETEKIIKAATYSKKPCYIRLVRPDTPPISSPKTSFVIGKSSILKRGNDVTILGYGPILSQAINLQTNASLEIINCSSIKPLDVGLIKKSIRKTGRLIVLEDHQKHGGLGEAVAALLLASNLHPSFIHLAVDNQFGQSSRDFTTLYNYYGLGSVDLEKSIKKLIKK